MKTTVSHTHNWGRLIRWAFIFATFALVSIGQAEIRKFEFRGTIANVDNPYFFLDNSITNGAPFEGNYIFDTSIVDSNSDTTVGDYQYSSSTFGVVFKVGNYVFRTDPERVDFLVEIVDRDTDNYLFLSYNNVCSPPVLVDAIAWQLDDPSGTAWTNDALPSVVPVLSDFQGSSLTINGLHDGFTLDGRVDSIQANAVVTFEQPVTEVGLAVEVKWQSQLGYFYQVQRSKDMVNWTNIGEPILGDGTVLSKFFPPDDKRYFYRAEIKNFFD